MNSLSKITSILLIQFFICLMPTTVYATNQKSLDKMVYSNNRPQYHVKPTTTYKPLASEYYQKLNKKVDAVLKKKIKKKCLMTIFYNKSTKTALSHKMGLEMSL